MTMQLKFISKEDAHKLIDEVPGDGIMILQYDNFCGISDTGKYIRKRKGKNYVDKASVLVLARNDPISMLNLHQRYFSDFSDYKREKIVRSILLPKLEWYIIPIRFKIPNGDDILNVVQQFLLDNRYIDKICLVYSQYNQLIYHLW